MHAGSGERNSTRVLDSLSRFGCGTRTRADSLLRAHEMYVGASYPAMRRLYAMPCPVSQWETESARFSESVWLSAGAPSLSV